MKKLITIAAILAVTSTANAAVVKSVEFERADVNSEWVAVNIEEKKMTFDARSPFSSCREMKEIMRNVAEVGKTKDPTVTFIDKPDQKGAVMWSIRKSGDTKSISWACID